MTGNPFTGVIALQEEMLGLHRRQLDLAAQALKAGEDLFAMQKAGRRAAGSGTKAWLGWLELWTGRQ